MSRLYGQNTVPARVGGKRNPDYHREWKRRNPGLRRASNRRTHTSGSHAKAQRKYRLRKYGLTNDQYEGMVSRQNGLCAICQKPYKLVVDHNHETGRVRGLLCFVCNKTLGHIESGWHLKALTYLEATDGS